jgi:hypothetical protein
MRTLKFRTARVMPVLDQRSALAAEPQSGEFAAMTKQCGYLAQCCCATKLPLRVLRSRAGFYIGTADAAGPVSRESEEYFGTRAAAVQALRAGRWTQRHQP